MKTYLYHRVPDNMQGNILFPLNTLKEIHPDIYEKQAGKYDGREQVMNQQIPILDCLWNDVLHFSAVHPSLIREALIAAGRTNPIRMEVFEIDPHMLDPENTIVYLYQHTNPEDKFKPENLAKYNPEYLEKYSILPEETKEYYKEMVSQDKHPLLFHRVPHILYKGNLDISTLKKIG